MWRLLWPLASWVKISSSRSVRAARMTVAVLPLVLACTDAASEAAVLASGVIVEPTIGSELSGAIGGRLLAWPGRWWQRSRKVA